MKKNPAPAATGSARPAKRSRKPAEIPISTLDPKVIATLPVELLRLIFAYIPRFPLLKLVSLVCRRWRAAALSSITALTLRSEHAALQLLPSLTHLRVTRPTASCAPPQTLRELDFSQHVYDFRQPMFIDPAPFLILTNITSLHLDTGMFTREHLSQLAEPFSASIRTLSLRFESNLSPHVTFVNIAAIRALASAPNLTSLSFFLFLSEHAAGAQQCFRDTRFSALTSLTIALSDYISTSIVEPFLQHNFACLTDFTLQATELPKGLFPRLFSRAPVLRRLSYRMLFTSRLQGPAEVEREVRDMLIEFPIDMNSRAIHWLIQDAKNIRHANFFNSGSFPHHASRRVAVDGLIDSHHLPANYGEDRPGYVRFLDLHTVTMSAEIGFDQLSRFFKALYFRCPHLREIHLRGLSHLFTKVSRAMIKFLQEAESAGVERVYWPIQMKLHRYVWTASNPLPELRKSLNSLELVPTSSFS